MIDLGDGATQVSVKFSNVEDRVTTSWLSTNNDVGNADKHYIL